MEAAETTPLPTGPEGPAPTPLRPWVLVVGYIGALLAPFVGVLIGVLALMRRQTRHAALIFLITAAMIGLGIAAGVDGRGSDNRSDGSEPAQIDLSSPKWKAFNACIEDQRYDAKQVIAHCHVPGSD